MEAPALFVRDGDRFVATTYAIGPWNPAQTDGSSALALVTRCVELVPTLVPMSIARLTVDLQRALPVGRPVSVHTHVVREGKKLQVVEATITADDLVCVRATVLRLREADFTGNELIPDGTTQSDPRTRITSPDDSTSLRDLRTRKTGAIVAADLRYAQRTDSPATGTWVNLTTPVVAGEPITQAERMAYAFDFASLVGMSIDSTALLMINTDVNAHVLRPLVGEWIALVGETRVSGPHGRSISMVEACDAQGVFAVVSAVQLVEPR